MPINSNTNSGTNLAVAIAQRMAAVAARLTDSSEYIGTLGSSRNPALTKVAEGVAALAGLYELQLAELGRLATQLEALVPES